MWRVNKRAPQWALIIQKHIKTHHTNQHLLTNTLCSTDFICGAELICILMTNTDKCTDLLRVWEDSFSHLNLSACLVF